MIPVPHFLKVLIEQKVSAVINLKLDGKFCISFEVQFISQPPPAYLGHRKEVFCVGLGIEAEIESNIFSSSGQS